MKTDHTLAISVVAFIIVLSVSLSGCTSSKSSSPPVTQTAITPQTTPGTTYTGSQSSLVASTQYQGKYVCYFDDSRYNKIVYILDSVNESLEPGSFSIKTDIQGDSNGFFFEGNPDAQIISLDDKKIVLKSLIDGSIITFYTYKLENDPAIISGNWTPGKIEPAQMAVLPTLTVVSRPTYVLANR